MLHQKAKWKKKIDSFEFKLNIFSTCKPICNGRLTDKFPACRPTK